MSLKLLGDEKRLISECKLYVVCLNVRHCQSQNC